MVAREAGFDTVRRSELPIDVEPRADVVVLDSIGELAQLYQIATAVFVGGSLADFGGHNILEPAVFGKPIAVTVLGNKFEVSELVFTQPLNTGVFWLRAGDKVVRCTKYEVEKEKDFVAWRNEARGAE